MVFFKALSSYLFCACTLTDRHFALQDSQAFGQKANYVQLFWSIFQTFGSCWNVLEIEFLSLTRADIDWLDHRLIPDYCRQKPCRTQMKSIIFTGKRRPCAKLCLSELWGKGPT